jgi:hypothetical protein
MHTPFFIRMVLHLAAEGDLAHPVLKKARPLLLRILVSLFVIAHTL